jgi:hypothetical protein
MWCIGHMIRVADRRPVLTLLSSGDDRKLLVWQPETDDRGASPTTYAAEPAGVTLDVKPSDP